MIYFRLDCGPELTSSGLLKANSFINVSNVSCEDVILSMYRDMNYFKVTLA